MKIYMDVCCLSRPFDDLSQERVYLEAEAVLSLISGCRNGDWTLVASWVIDFELSNSSNLDKLSQVMHLYSTAQQKIAANEQAEKRAAFFVQNGLKPLDSLHLAAAETSSLDVFLTTDDHLLKTARKLDLEIKVANPVVWLMEVNND